MCATLWLGSPPNPTTLAPPQHCHTCDEKYCERQCLGRCEACPYLSIVVGPLVRSQLAWTSARAEAQLDRFSQTTSANPSSTRETSTFDGFENFILMIICFFTTWLSSATSNLTSNIFISQLEKLLLANVLFEVFFRKDSMFKLNHLGMSKGKWEEKCYWCVGVPMTNAQSFVTFVASNQFSRWLWSRFRSWIDFNSANFCLLQLKKVKWNKVENQGRLKSHLFPPAPEPKSCLT